MYSLTHSLTASLTHSLTHYIHRLKLQWSPQSDQTHVPVTVMAPPIEGQVVTRDTHSAGDHQVCQLEKGFSVPASYEEDAHSNLLCIKRFQDYIHAAAHRNADRLRHVFIIVFLGLYTIYFGFAIAKSVDGAMALIVLTSITVLLYIYVQIRDNLGSGIWKICLNPALRCIRRYRACVKW